MKKIICLSALVLAALQMHAQEKKSYEVGVVAFYNLENYFDTLDQKDHNDDDFLPNGPYHNTSEVFLDKSSKLSDVISQIGTDVTPDGVSMMGVAEVENKGVLETLVNQPKLRNRHYSIVHYESPDLRGIDVGFLYQPKYFKVLSSKPLPTLLYEPNGERIFTRDVLYVKGIYGGTDTMHIFVNHWPSRRGGEEASRALREKAADVDRKAIDSIQAISPNAKILVMGDLNDDPDNSSVVNHIRAKGNKDKVKPDEFFNPWMKFFKEGLGTLAYNDSWNLFDQIMLSYPLIKKDATGFHYNAAHVFNQRFMTTLTGKYKGYPKRTYDGNNYQGGYSDHFPTYILLVREKK